MNVSQVFQTLSLGSLSNLSMSNSGSGTIIEEKQPTVVLHINEALLRLYSRFVLKESDVTIQMYPQITSYHLKAKFAQSYDPAEGETPQPIRYIIDRFATEPFKDDVVRILKVFDTLGREHVLNNESSRFSLFTPRAKVLQVPRPIPGEALSISYQARHVPILPGDLEAEIEIPEVLEEAFYSYVAHKVFTNIGGDENILRGQNFLASYEASCVETETKDTIGVSNSPAISVFEQRGWI
jgi:hypothetical protein